MCNGVDDPLGHFRCPVNVIGVDLRRREVAVLGESAISSESLSASVEVLRR